MLENLMYYTRDLSYEDVQWLDVFSKDNHFFHSLKEYYQENDYLTKNQYFYLQKAIKNAENKGDTVLSRKEIKILRNLAEENHSMRELLRNYSDYGYLNRNEYDIFKRSKLSTRRTRLHQNLATQFSKNNQNSLSPLPYSMFISIGSL